jgi:dolichol-phosphate mannosyltransferase
MNIAIVMPTYNEASNIGRMIDILFEEVFPEISDAEMCLIVADDDSPDGTGRIVEERLDRYSNLFLLPGKKRGLGHAYVRGFKYAMNELKVDAVVEMDADF